MNNMLPETISKIVIDNELKSIIQIILAAITASIPGTANPKPMVLKIFRFIIYSSYFLDSTYLLIALLV